jgi:hypothetical protein
MREKDEGDLFGIRAIEAGYFGGVAQSAPNSPTASRTNSRNNSPAPSNRIPYGGHSSPATPQLLPHLHYHDSISASSSVLDLGQYRDSVGQSSLIPSIRLSKSSSALIDHPPLIDSVFSVLSPAGYAPSSLRQPESVKLRPSQAELNGRINHTSPFDVSADGPPSPQTDQRRSLDCPFHGSPQKQDRTSTGPNLPVYVPDRVSHISTISSVYPFPEEWEESTLSEPARLVNGPEQRGKKTVEVGSLDNPAVDEKSQRGSIVSRVSSSTSFGQQLSNHFRQQIAKGQYPPVPPMRMPLFQKKAIIGASNPEFDRFRKERMHKDDDDDEPESSGKFSLC